MSAELPTLAPVLPRVGSFNSVKEADLASGEWGQANLGDEGMSPTAGQPFSAVFAQRSVKDTGKYALSALGKGADTSSVAATAGGGPPRGGEPDALTLAMSALRELAADSDVNQDAIREAGGIPPLVYLLQAGNDDDVLEATGALAQLCLSPAVVGDVIASGGVASLVALLQAYAQSKPPSAAHAAAACTACGSLAVHPGLHGQLAGAGVVTHLVAHLLSSPPVAQAAAQALATMASRSDTLLRQALAAGALEAATGLLAAGAAGQATTGACALLAALLTQGGDDVRDAFTALDGIDAVVDVLDVRQVGAPGVGGGAVVVVALCSGGSPGAAEAVADVVQHTDAISRLVAIVSTSATPRETAVRAAQALGELAPGPGAKDTMYAAGAIPPLVRLLQPGDPDDTATGAVASVLARLADTHAGCREGVASVGGIPLLVQLLSPPLPSVGATAAAGALWYLARSAGNKEAIREAGGIPALVALLVCGPDCDVTFKAAAALWSLADSSTVNKDAIREAGGIPALVRLLSCGPERRATLKAAGALGSLAFAPANKDAIRQARAIPALVTLLRCGPSRAITLNATVALSNLASSPEARADMVADGALPLLLALLQAPPGREVVAVAAGVVAKLCQAESADTATAPEAADARQAVLDAGGVAPLVHVVRTASPDGAAVVNAACALWHLGSSAAGGFAVRQEGGLDALVALLQAPDASVEAVTKGAAALWTLAEGSGANADAIINAHGADALVALLLEGGTSRAAINAAGALGALAAASQVAASECARGGACAALGQLISLLRASGGEPGPEPQAEGPLVVALTSLCRLASNPAGLAACRAVPGLVELLVDVCGVGAATEGAPWAVPTVQALTILAAGGHGPTCEAVRAAGGVPALVGLLHWPHWPEATAAAAAACGVLARGGPVLRDELHQLATPPLLALLRPGGDAPTAAAAAAAFGALAAAAPVEREYVRTCGALELLYAMVKDTSLPDCCEAAASALAAAVVDSYGNKAILRDAGAMALCAQLVQAPPSSGAAAAVALLLGRLAEGAGRGATPIGSPRAASPRPGASVFEPQAPASQAPGSSSPVPSEHEDALLASGAVTQLVSHLGGHPDAPVTRAAVSSLASMADSSDGCAAIIARDGGLAHLVALLDAGHAHSVAADAAALLGHLASQPGGKDALREAGAIPKLVALLPGGPASAAAVHAAEVLWVLADGSAPNQEEMLACAAPTHLLRLLADALQSAAGDAGPAGEEAGDDRAALNGAGALCSLAETPTGVDAVLAAGGVPPLVELLRGEGYVESTVIAAVALSHLADSAAGRTELVAQGVVPVLVAHLSAGPEHDITVLSATLLAKLAEADDAHAREEIAEHESGHLFLIALLYAMSYHECVLQAATTLWFLARDPAYAQLLVDSGVVPALVGVLGNAEEDPDAGAIAAAALAAICAGSAERTRQVAAQGGLASVAQALLAPGCALDSQLAGRSAWTLAALAAPEAGGAQVADDVVATGVVPRLVAQLDCGAGVDATLAGASALGVLANTPAGQEAILEAGACAPLVALLASGPEAPVTVAAARLLTTLATGSGPAREAIRVAGGIQPLVTLLQSGPEAPVTAKAAAALVALAKSPENKEEIRRAGGIAQLVALLGAAAKVGSPRPGSPLRERPLPAVVEAQ